MDAMVDGIGIRVDAPHCADRLTPFTHALAPSDGAPPGVHIEVRWDDAPHPPAGVGVSSFFQGPLQVSATSEGWLLWATGLWVSVRRAPVVEIRATSRRDPATLELLSRSALYIALALAMREHERFHLHAGLVDGEGLAWLLLGASGSGKTTTTLALATTGLCALADDAVFVRDELHATPLARAFHLSRITREAFAASAESEPLADGERHAVRVASPRRDGVTLTGILVLDAFAPRTRTRSLAASETLGRLLEQSALVAVDGASAVNRQLEVLARLAGRVPAVAVELGPDAMSHPAELRALVANALLRR